MKVRHVRVLAGKAIRYPSSRTWKKLRYIALINKQKTKKLSKAETAELKKLEKDLKKFLHRTVKKY